LNFNPKVKYIIEIGLLLGTAIIMALAISTGFTIYLGNPKHPHVAVTTASMVPIYNGFFQSDEYSPIEVFQGDILLVRKVPIESIKVGDVIIFDTLKVPDAVVHRVIAIWEVNNTYYFKTNGDNNLSPDDWETTGDDVYGVVVNRIPHIGWFLLAIQTTLGRLLVFMLAILVLFLGDGSEEEENTPQENETKIGSNPGSKSFKPRIKNHMNKILKEKSYFYSFCAILIVLLFLGSNVLSAVFQSPSIKLYSLEDNTRSQNLLFSSESTTFQLSIPNARRPNYEWSEIENNSKSYFFPIRIDLRSGGICNNIASFEIISNVDDREGLYRWTIMYNFIGTRTIEGGIIAHLDPSITSHEATITLILYIRGLFVSTPQIFHFPLILDSS
jgi:signal peptidase I